MKVRNETRLGIVVFLSALILIAGIVYLRGIDLRTREYSFTILYDNVNGLQEGSLISVAGLTIGSVSDMSLHGRDIAVTVSIQRDIRLPKDSQAIIKSESIMGGKFIEIAPGESHATLANGDTLRGVYEADLTQLTATLAPISSNVLGILENVNSTFDSTTRHDIKSIVAELNRSSAELQRVIRNNGSSFDAAMRDFSRASVHLARFTAQLDSIGISGRPDLDSTLHNLRRIAERVNRSSVDLQSSSRSLGVIMQKIEGGEGTLGKLVYQEGLYNNLDSLSANLNLLVKDIRENPGRYVRVSLF